MSSGGGLIDIAVELRHETEKAYLVNTGEGEMWLPKYQVEYYKERTTEIVTMPYWLANEKGLI
jgi:hypothetical protein